MEETSPRIEFVGRIERVVYPKPGQEARNDFYILLVEHLEDEVTVSVKGRVKNPVVGDRLLFVGEYEGDNQWGNKDFKLHYATFPRLDTDEGLKRYLQKVAGEKTGELIFTRFGKESLEVLNNEPERLLQVPGIKEKTLERIKESHGEFAAEINPEVFSRLRGHMSEYIIRLGLERWKGGFERIVRDNPYRLTELKGVRFTRADEVGLSMGIAHNSPFRIAAAIRYVMEEHEGLGHTYAVFAALCEDTASSLQVTGKVAIDPIEVAPVLEELCESKKLIREGNRVYTLDTYNDENGLARRLAYYSLGVTPLKVTASTILPDIVKEFRETYQNPHFTFGTQQEAFLNSLHHNLLLLQGDPGTGKTTTTRGALRLLQYGFSKRILAVAPTGKAARRMAEALGIDTMTIHRALGYNPEDGNFEFNTKNKLAYDAFLVDEVSMLDTPIGAAFMKAIPLEAKVILIGDIYQLPSVGVGKVLHDMVNSGIIPMIHMTEVYRQGQDSGIIQNARLINEGKFPNARGKLQDYSYHDITGQDEIMATIVEEARILYFESDDWIVLMPNKGNNCGTENVNLMLQEELNPIRPGELDVWIDRGKKKRPFSIRQRDKVIHVRNEFRKLCVANGETGLVTRIRLEEELNADDKPTGRQIKAVYVEYPDGIEVREVRYSEDQAKDYLELAWAITCHKSQGSEWKHVIIAIGVGIPTLMKRNLLYTAETRAKKGCTLIAPRKLVYQMVNTPDTDQRLTTLKERIIGYAQKKLQETPPPSEPQKNWWGKLKQAIGL